MSLDHMHAALERGVGDAGSTGDAERWAATHAVALASLLEEFVPEYLDLRARVIADDDVSNSIISAAFALAGGLAVPLQSARRRPDLLVAAAGTVYDPTDALQAADLMFQSLLALGEPEGRWLSAEPDELQQLLDMPMLRALREAAADE